MGRRPLWNPLPRATPFPSGHPMSTGLSALLNDPTNRAATRPYWKPSVEGMLPSGYPIFFTLRCPNCNNAVCHRCEENAKGSICARIVKAQIFLLTLTI